MAQPVEAEVAGAETRRPAPSAATVWPWLALAVCGGQVALGAAGFAAADDGWSRPAGSPIGLWVSVVQSLVSASAGAWLLLLAGGEARARLLGGALLAIGSAFALRPTRVLLESGGLSAPLEALAAFPTEAFLPLLWWLFFSRFPRTLRSRPASRVWRTFAGASIVLAGLCLAGWLAQSLGLSNPWASFTRTTGATLYSAAAFALVAPSLPFALWRSRAARSDEKRRVRVFLLGLGAGMAPAILYNALALNPSFVPWARSSGFETLSMPLIQIAIAGISVVTAYSVAVDRVFDVAPVLRATLRYAVARASVFLLALAPFLAAVLILADARALPLTEILTGARLAELAALVAAGALLFRRRRALMDALDRRFFREAYDSRTILAELASNLVRTSSRSDLVRQLVSGIERALHPEVVLVLTRSLDGRFQLAAGGSRPLPAGSKLVDWLRRGPEWTDADLADPDSPLRDLPLDDRDWLVDSRVRLLLPVRGAEGELLGAVLLGEKRSEVPYSREDRQLLLAIAASGGLALENWLMRESGALPAPAPPSETERTAMECPTCHRLAPHGAERCSDCQGSLEAAPVPMVLNGKFRMERRIGTGGMGVVYSALDQALGREVAIKTLPRVSPERALELRREARVMAAVRHPALALVYTVESFKGTPVLVVELLAGGTLADRLAEAPLQPDRVVALGRDLAGALERIHGAGFLHRDVKPSNIGFARDGDVKLMDFGLASALDDVAPPSEPLGAGDLQRVTASGGSTLLGTPLYLSPEALTGAEPDPSFDLWALGVVLYEALTGANPLERSSWERSMHAILNAQVLDPRERVGCPDDLAETLLAALDFDRGRRPHDARDFRRRLEAIAVAPGAD